MELPDSRVPRISWNKKGLIFRVTEHLEPCISFAQSPQLLKLEDRHRVYFCGRYLDRFGLPVSRVYFVDFSHDFSKILDVRSEPVLSEGNLGEFDEHGIFPFHPASINGNTFGFSSGWSRRQSVPVETAIGITVLSEGGNFIKLGRGPILAANYFEPFLVCDPYLFQESNNKFSMYYISGERWLLEDEKPERVYKIRCASSEDLKRWTPDGIQLIPDVLGPNECQALPSVVSVGDLRIMAFCYRPATDFRGSGPNTYRLGGAVSVDGKNWVRCDEIFNFQTEIDAWDSEMQCYPNISLDGQNLILLYNGNEFGREGFGLSVGEIVDT